MTCGSSTHRRMNGRGWAEAALWRPTACSLQATVSALSPEFMARWARRLQIPFRVAECTRRPGPTRVATSGSWGAKGRIPSELRAGKTIFGRSTRLAAMRHGWPEARAQASRMEVLWERMAGWAFLLPQTCRAAGPWHLPGPIRPAISGCRAERDGIRQETSEI